MIQRASNEAASNTIKLTRSLQLSKPVLTSDGVFSNDITLNNSFLVLDFQNLPELYYDTDTDTYHFELGTSGTGTAISILDNGSLITSSVSSIDFTGNIVITADPLDSSILTVDIPQITIDVSPILSGTAGRVLFESSLNQVSESVNLNWDNTNSLLQIGEAGVTQGGLVLAGSTSGLLTLNANSATTDYTLTFPDTVGAENQILVLTDNAGTLAFTDDFYFQTTPPSPNPIKLGARWIDSDNGVEYVWVYDGVNYLWMQPTQLGNVTYQTFFINAATYSPTFSYEYYGVTYTGGICTITLPLGTSTTDDGRFITIADEVGGISYGNRGILVQGSGGQLINGETSVLMRIERMSLTFLFRNNSWKTI
jgi:hypothetical protein